MNKILNDYILTVNDYENITNIISNLKENDYFHLFKELNRLSQEQKNNATAKILRLISCACSMMLQPDNTNSPLKPFYQGKNQTSTTENSFSKNELDFFENIVKKIENLLIKSRIADILWLTRRNINFANLAIESYSKINSEPLVLYECYTRALTLASQIRKTDDKIYKNICTDLISRLNQYNYTTADLPIKISKILFKFLKTRDRYFEIAYKLENISDLYKSNNNALAQHLYRESQKWFLLMKNEEESARIKVKEGDFLFQISQIRGKESQFTKKSFCEDALQVYRSIPKKYRNQFNIEQRIKTIEKNLLESGTNLINETITISSPSFDISDEIKKSRKLISKKSLFDAFDTLTSFSIFDIASLKDSAIENLNTYSYHLIAGKTFFGKYGNITIKIPPYNRNEDENKNKEAIFQEMASLYLEIISIFVRTNIIPMLEIMHLEHHVREQDFYTITLQSPIVPNDDKLLFAKALYEGYCMNYASSLHLLCPRIENLIRTQLKIRKISTTIIDENGIEQEIGLSNLLAKEETKKIFGESLIFELNCLLCYQGGLNLRNEVAHGLVNDEIFYFHELNYVWCLIFRIVFHHYKYLLKINNKTSQLKIAI